MRRSVRGFIVIVLGALGVPAVACVIADPPASVPPTPLVPPAIEQESVSPTPGVLRSWPSSFAIPVLVLDSSQAVEWREFIDYPIAGDSYPTSGTLEPGQTLDDAGDRMIDQPLSRPSDLNACHTVEILVAYGFASNHTPNPPGGASVTWIYSPTGSLDGCPIFEAGAEGEGGTEDASSVIIPEDAGAGG